MWTVILIRKTDGSKTILESNAAWTELLPFLYAEKNKYDTRYIVFSATVSYLCHVWNRSGHVITIG